MARIIFDKNTLIVRSDRYQNTPKLGSKGSGNSNGGSKGSSKGSK